MKEYKRLTIRNSDGTVSQPYGENIVEKVFYRLAELEDKIENGTLCLADEVRKEMLDEFYTAIWRHSFRLAHYKAEMLNLVEKLGKKHGFSIEDKVEEQFKENATTFCGYLKDIIRYAEAHINVLKEHYGAEVEGDNEQG